MIKFNQLVILFSAMALTGCKHQLDLGEYDTPKSEYKFELEATQGSLDTAILTEIADQETTISAFRMNTNDQLESYQFNEKGENLQRQTITGLNLEAPQFQQTSAGSLIYQAGELTQYDEQGNISWSYDLNDHEPNALVQQQHISEENGTAYIGYKETGSSPVVIKVVDGFEISRFQTDADIEKILGMTSNANTLYMAVSTKDSNARLYTLDEMMTPISEINEHKIKKLTPFPEGLIYINEGAATAINYLGENLWQMDIDSKSVLSISAGNDQLYIITRKHQNEPYDIEALDFNGSKLWDQPISEGAFKSVVEANGKVAVSSSVRKLIKHVPENFLKVELNWYKHQIVHSVLDRNGNLERTIKESPKVIKETIKYPLVQGNINCSGQKNWNNISIRADICFNPPTTTVTEEIKGWGDLFGVTVLPNGDLVSLRNKRLAIF